MKRINLIFCVLAVLAALAGAVHTAVCFVLTQQSMTSAPAWVALFVLVPYALAELVLLCAWGVVRAVHKKRCKKRGGMV